LPKKDFAHILTNRSPEFLKGSFTVNHSMNFVEELRWRGMLHDMMPGTEELLAKEQVTDT